MVGGFITSMARLAVVGPRGLMVKTGRRPECGIVTRATLISKVIGRFMDRMTAETIRCTGDLMVKLDQIPCFGRVTGGTIPRVMITGLLCAVAGFAVGWCSIVNASGVAIWAPDRCMLTYQRIKLMLTGQAASWKWDRHRVDGGIGIIGLGHRDIFR